ncbi:YozE family protein [Flammeovirga sp. MY04]|uniref:YozE family protein n=1 Tax=Flammeovirga sp. MY04 TaxID=1191459 RepID=UPI00082698E4|nr:YozE family protein [Flammeovirga sp. MY04]
MMSTFYNYILETSKEDTAVGDLANDILNDMNFPWGTDEEEILGYLDFHTSMGGTNDVFHSLMMGFSEYNSANSKKDNSENI